MGITTRLWYELATSDCEVAESGFIAQPVNTVSSLAYVLVGAWVVGRGLRDTSRRWLLIIFGSALVAEGVGSVLFHGPQWPGSGWVHDAALVAVIGFIPLYDLALIRRWSLGPFVRFYAALVALAGIVLVLLPDATNVLTGVLAAAALGFEAALYRFRPEVARPRGDRGREIAYWGAIVLLAAALAANLLGRTGAPLCDPDSLLQGHALWHILSALALGGYAFGVIEYRPGLSVSDPAAP
jgi:hypothetical protein